jgi:hypothetical protein
MGIQDYADQVNDAYAAHESMYEKRNPKPEPPKKLTWKDVTGEMLIIIVLAIMVVASVIVSGSRTVPEFGGGLIGMSAFIMLEGGIIAYAYIRTKRSFSVERRNQVFKLLAFGLGFAFLISIAANVHVILKANGIELGQAVDLGIAIAVAISAPTLALISGDLLGMEAVAATQMKKRRQEEYEKKMEEWRNGLNEEWKRAASRLGVQSRVSVSAPSLPDEKKRQLPAIVNSVDNVNDVDSVNTRSVDNGNKRQRVEDYLIELKESGQQRPSFEVIAGQLGVTRQYVHRISQEMERVSLSTR